MFSILYDPNFTVPFSVYLFIIFLKQIYDIKNDISEVYDGIFHNETLFSEIMTDLDDRVSELEEYIENQEKDKIRNRKRNQRRNRRRRNKKTKMD